MHSPAVLAAALACALSSLECSAGTAVSFRLAPGSPTALSGRPEAIVLADYNGDGRNDVALGFAQRVEIWFGDGRGAFARAPSTIQIASTLLATGDMNRDSVADLVTADHDSFDVSVFLGRGDGTFAPAPGSPFAAPASTGPHTHGLVLGDVNGDGALDTTTVNHDDASVSVLLGDGAGGFRPAPGSPFRVGRAPYPHALGDVNRDGRLDIATPNVGGDSISVLLGDGRGGFTHAPRSSFPVGLDPWNVAIGDVDADGRGDVVASHAEGAKLTALLGNGRGGFRPAPGSPFAAGVGPYGLVLVDVNDDGRPDAIVGNQGGSTVTVLLATRRGGFKPAPGSPYAVGRDPLVAVGDVSGDGRPDVVTADNGSNTLSVLLAT